MNQRSNPQKGQHASSPLWHALDVDQLVRELQTHVEQGLSQEEADRRLLRYGRNELGEPKGRSLLAVFFSQFRSPLIYLLFAAAAIALSLGHRSDAAVIFVVVLVNSVIGTIQEGRAEQSLVALRKLTRHQARAIRSGKSCVLSATDLVPGDLLHLEAGDAVPADCRIVEAAALQMAEAALTGESEPIPKDTTAVAPDVQLADRRCMAYAGTFVTSGRAKAVVVGTGKNTEIGRIAELAEAPGESATPLERRIEKFGHTIMLAAGGLFLLVVGIGAARGIPIRDLLMVGISQIVGLIPEGLPVAMTIALAVGVQRMAQRRAVVRRLAAVEALGSTTTICSDKTGTLTKNEITIREVYLADGRSLSVTGSGYDPSGEVTHNSLQIRCDSDAALAGLVEAAVLCNDADLVPPSSADEHWKPMGDPTEIALLTFAEKCGARIQQFRAKEPRVAELPFSSATKMMATQHDRAGGSVVFVKGAPEVILELCTLRWSESGPAELSESALERARGSIQQMASKALRVLALARVEGGEITEVAGERSLRGQGVLLGLVGQMDPPRPEVRDAVEQCRRAGIRAVMVTGDHKATGLAIAQELHIARDGDMALDGRELEAMSDHQLSGVLDRVSVFARVHPSQKVRIVEAFQRQRHIVAMTGDGVNDAPALVKADVGVAMGRSGTEVAKEASEIVISDDHFATIVAAVEEGRVVYRNIKKVVLYLFSTSTAEVVMLVVALSLGYPPPLSAVQILWINLVTEGTVTVNLIMEPAEGDEMQQKPVPVEEPLISRPMLSRMMVMTPCIALSALGWFIVRFESGVPFAQVQTETFTVLAVCQWFNVLNCRSEHRSAFSLGFLRNLWLVGGLLLSNLLHLAVIYFRPLGDVFHTVPIEFTQVLAIGALASLVLWAEEGRKLIQRIRGARSGPAKAVHSV
ncbi:MAG: HAD-IC family P-type ATPase [Planctomycetes bacterium]|nr:HAD-IC family P-type ATPase [Planctomycetota bacterium]